MDITKSHYLTQDEYEEIQKQNPDVTVEYYGGDIIMSSHSSNRHNEIISNILLKLLPFFKGSKCKVRHEQIEVILGYNTDFKEYVFPDIFVACDKNMKGESYIEAPQIVFEVVSPDYAINDYARKLKLYQRHGVLEYIIVDPQAKCMFHYYLSHGAFMLSSNDNYISKLFSGLELSLEEAFE